MLRPPQGHRWTPADDKALVDDESGEGRMRETLEEAIDERLKCDLGAVEEVLAGQSMLRDLRKGGPMAWDRAHPQYDALCRVASFILGRTMGSDLSNLPILRARETSGVSDGVTDESQRDAVIERLHGFLQVRSLRAAGELLSCMEDGAEPDPRSTRKAIDRYQTERKTREAATEAALRQGRESLRKQLAERGL